MFVNENNTGHRPDGGKYGDVIKKIAKDGVCPFCIEHLSKYHPNPLDEREYWFVTDNAYPYKPKKHHKLLISKVHIEHYTQLSKPMLDELQEIVRELNVNLGIEGGTFVMRYGTTKYTGASVTHLHAHLFQSDPDGENYDPKMGIIMRIG
jgi:ATP adenylyltransferase